MARSIFRSQISDIGNLLIAGSSIIIESNGRISANVTTVLSTSDVSEGSNLYYTNARVNSFIQGNLATKANVTDLTTANVAELTNLYYTNARVVSVLTPYLTTSNVSEGSNLYYTNARVRSALSAGTGVSYDNSTGAISIGQNVSSTANVTFTNLTVSGDLVVQGNTVTLNTSTVNIEDKNLLLANGAINAAAADGAGITIDGANATITYVNATNSWNLNKDIIVTSNVTANIFNGNLVGNATGTAGTLSNFTTANLAEGSNLYYSNARVLSALTGNVTIGNLTLTGNITGAAVLKSYVNSYKGNSQSATLTLPITPISSNFVTVIINGVAQLSSAYTVSGNVLTFTSYPTTNADIDVRILDVSQPIVGEATAQEQIHPFLLSLL